MQRKKKLIIDYNSRCNYTYQAQKYSFKAISLCRNITDSLKLFFDSNAFRQIMALKIKKVIISLIYLLLKITFSDVIKI